MDNNLKDMKVLIIGYGSIGKKHYKIIKNNFKNIQIFLLSKRNLFIKGASVFNTLKEVKNLEFDYVIIASEPHEHFFQLKFFEKNFKNLKILVEKPLFNKEKKLQIKNNKIFVGYNLRFHPAIAFLEKFLSKNNPIDIKLITNSFLPKWRKKSNHKNYSSDKRRGGGVIFDLSHEIDLALWLFGNIKIEHVKFNKISKLKINTEDNLQLIGKIRKSNFFLNLSYYSKNELRNIYLDTTNKSLFIDLRNNIIKVDNKIRKILSKSHNIDKTYLDLHKAILFDPNNKKLCSIQDGYKVLQLITQIKKNYRTIIPK